MKRLWKKLLRLLGLKPVGKMSINAVLIHANGSREDLGTIAKGKINMTPAANPKE